jgi:hypothetical protein
MIFEEDEGVEARDGIEPSNKALQTLPFSFWVPRQSQRHGEMQATILTFYFLNSSPVENRR